MNNLSKWMRAVRVPTLTASIIPVALGGILACNNIADHTNHFYPVRILLAAISMTFFQIASNLINDVDDFNNQVDTKESLGSSRVIVDALLSQKQVITAAGVFFFTAAAIGIYLVVLAGPVILIFGVLGAAGTYFYTGKPFQFKYRGYGIPLVFLMFGPLPVLGAHYLSAGTISLTPVLLSLPVGFLTTAILHANDLRDIEHDAKANIKSFAIVLGGRGARLFYLMLILGSFMSVPVLALSGFLTYWSLLVFLSAPLAVKLIYSAQYSTAVKTLDHQTAGLQLTFGFLLLISTLL